MSLDARITFRLKASSLRKLKKLAKQYGDSVSVILRDLVEGYLSIEDHQPPSA